VSVDFIFLEVEEADDSRGDKCCQKIRRAGFHNGQITPLAMRRCRIKKSQPGERDDSSDCSKNASLTRKTTQSFFEPGKFVMNLLQTARKVKN
jgi:hypothetical protein